MKNFIIIILALATNAYASGLRNNLKRYTLVRDKTIIDQLLRGPLYETFADVDLTISSGVKDLMGDVKNISTNSSSSDADKEIEIVEILNKNINSEHYADLNATLGIPLPTIKIKALRLTPTFFFNMNMSTLFTISNIDDPIDPSVSVYMKKESKIGVSTILSKKRDKNTLAKLNLYLLTRADSSIIQNKTSLVENTKIYDFGKLDSGEKSIGADFIYQKTSSRRTYRLEILEIKALPMSLVKDVEYDHFPLFHAFHQWHLQSSDKFYLEPFAGIHMRKRYSFFEGLYVGTWLKMRDVPFRASLNLSKQFITFVPELKRESFFFNYKLRMTYINPQDDIWVPTVHSFNIGYNF